jgi:two-component system OmpR family sensor kinase
VRLPGGIRTKLALALLVIVGGSLAVAYAIVVPSLEKRLVDAKLEQLASDANSLGIAYVRRSFSSPLEDDEYVYEAAEFFNARVVVFEVLGQGESLTLATHADSSPVTASGLLKDPVALETARTGRSGRTRVRRGGREFAEAAVPLLDGDVLLLSASLADQLSTVRQVERRLLYASAAALLIALGLGTTAAAVHARRIRRLERAANRIAQSHFDEPVVDGGRDELGELASAFERMRVQLSQLDSARKEFVANASHELRTPLFSLGGFLELLADEDLDEETRRGFLVTTREQVERLTKLSGDLLDLSRMDAGRLRVEREDVDLAEVCTTLAEELDAFAETGGHRFEVDADADVWALADEERVLQIGRALVSNALVHTPPGSYIVVRAWRDRERVALAVEDDGPGIAAEHLESIFDRFYRVEGGHAWGSGLGLAIARELAERMGGEVRVESRPGRTLFTLFLPALSERVVGELQRA